MTKPSVPSAVVVRLNMSEVSRAVIATRSWHLGKTTIARNLVKPGKTRQRSIHR